MHAWTLLGFLVSSFAWGQPAPNTEIAKLKDVYDSLLDAQAHKLLPKECEYKMEYNSKDGLTLIISRATGMKLSNGQPIYKRETFQMKRDFKVVGPIGFKKYYTFLAEMVTPTREKFRIEMVADAKRVEVVQAERWKLVPEYHGSVLHKKKKIVWKSVAKIVCGKKYEIRRW